MVLVLVVGASGTLAAWTRPLTAVALASTAAVPRKPLREIMWFLLSMPARLAGRCRHGACSFAAVARPAAAGHRRLEVHAREPEVALRLDRCDRRGDALARLRQQREHVDQHRVVAKQCFVRDDLAQRQDLTLVVAGDLVGVAIDKIGVARLRADIDW